MEKFVLNDMVRDERGLIAFQTFSIDEKALAQDENATTTYFTEEFVSMILAYGKSLADEQAGGRLKQAVITIPCYYTQE